MQITQAIILAGGQGRRLVEVSAGLPKPLVPVAGVPVIVRQIELLARAGVQEIFVTTNFKADLIRDALGDGSLWGVMLQFVHEEMPLGTAGGVAAIHHGLQGDFFVLYGDVLVNMNLVKLAAAHHQNRADATIVVHPNDHPYDSDLVAFTETNEISGWFPYPRFAHIGDLPNMVSAGLYVLSRNAISFIEAGVKQDFVRDVFPRMAKKCRICAYPTTEYLKDMGTPERLNKVERDVRSGKVARMHSNYRRPAIFVDRDGVLNEEVDGVLDPDALHLCQGAASAVAAANQAGWLVAVVTNQPVVAKGFMTEADLARVHNRLETLLGEEGAWVDSIAICQHHPEQGHPGERVDLKIECSCRKPKSGLFLWLESAMPVDLGTSAMVGDHWSDVVAAKRIGLDAILVRSGHRHLDPVPDGLLTLGIPDLVVDDLASAVEVLLEDQGDIQATADMIVSNFATKTNRLLVLLDGPDPVMGARKAFQLQRRLKANGVRCRGRSLDGWVENPDVESQFPPVSTIRSLLNGARVKMPFSWPQPVRNESRVRVASMRLDADVLVLHGHGISDRFSQEFGESVVGCFVNIDGDLEIKSC